MLVFSSGWAGPGEAFQASGPPQAPVPQVLLQPSPGDTSIWQVQFLTNTAARDGRALGTEKAMGTLHTAARPGVLGSSPFTLSTMVPPEQPGLLLGRLKPA